MVTLRDFKRVSNTTSHPKQAFTTMNNRKQVLLNRITEQTYNGIRIENYYMYKYQVEKISV